MKKKMPELPVNEAVILYIGAAVLTACVYAVCVKVLGESADAIDASFGIAGIAGMGYFGAAFCFVRFFEYKALLRRQRRAFRNGVDGPEAPLHAREAAFGVDENVA